MRLTMSQLCINASIMPLAMLTGTHDLINQSEMPALTNERLSGVRNLGRGERQRALTALTTAVSGTQLHSQISNSKVSPGSQSLHPPPRRKPYWAEEGFQGDFREGFKFQS